MDVSQGPLLRKCSVSWLGLVFVYHRSVTPSSYTKLYQANQVSEKKGEKYSKQKITRLKSEIFKSTACTFVSCKV